MVQFIQQYLVAVIGLGVGAAGGWLIGAAANGRLGRLDARITIPLLLAAAGAHLALIPVVELQRQVMFSGYVLTLLATVALAVSGRAIWRVGAVLLPAGSILGYAYFAAGAHEVDVVGLVVKVVELGAIAAAVIALRRRNRMRQPGVTSG